MRETGNRFARILTVAITAAVSFVVPTVNAVPILAPGTTWNWQIGSTPTDADIALVGTTGRRMLDVDMEETPASVIAKIKAKGIVAICYIETGSWESYRSDAGSYPESVKGNTLNGYPDERYVDIRQISVLRPIIDARLDRAVAKGCDGIEPDLDDTYLEGSATGFPLTFNNQMAFNTAIAADAHARGLLIGLKNGADAAFVPAMQPYVDFALNEQCNQYSECGPYTSFISAGKPVFQVEYSLSVSRFCPKDNAKNFDGIKKRPALNATPRTACR